MVLVSAQVKALPVPYPRQNFVDPRYRNEAFRMAQAKRYLDFFAPGSVVNLTAEEHVLIPQNCSFEIGRIRTWNSFLTVEKWMYNICNPFFSRLPSDGMGTLRVCAGCLLATAALLHGTYTRNDKLVHSAALGVIALLGIEMYSTNNR